jgi:tetratricopeptide (TPR) repeat protein
MATAHRLTRVALLVALATSTAAAQSRRYPPEPPDRDKEAEAHSDLWEGTLDPNLRPYAELVRDAELLLGHNLPADTQLALDKLGEAIARMPDEPAAYLTRGRIYLTRHDWSRCADDLGAAEEHAKDPDPVMRTRDRIDLAVCQARAGRLADAEQILIRASANAPAFRGELGLRLGETRIALGKLEEAIDALTSALEAGDIQPHLARWLLTLAYDRARRPTEAAEQGELARRGDPQRVYIEAPQLPFLGAGDQQYMLGVAYRYATPMPEIALLYFREFLRLAPDSPWRRRAEEHVRDLSAMQFPAKDTTATSNNLDSQGARKAIAGSMKALRACVAATPGTAYRVFLIRSGPRTPDAADRPYIRIPPSTFDRLMSVGEPPSKAEAQQVGDCLQKIANKIRLPAVATRDTYYSVQFLVISP